MYSRCTCTGVWKVYLYRCVQGITGVFRVVTSVCKVYPYRCVQGVIGVFTVYLYRCVQCVSEYVCVRCTCTGVCKMVIGVFKVYRCV